MNADMGTNGFTFHAPNRAEDCRQFVEWSAHTGWQTDYQQLGKGVFDGSLTIAHAGEIGVHRCVFSHELLIYASPPEGSVALVIPYSTGRRGVVQGHELGSDDVIVVPTGAEGFLRTAPNLSYYDIVVPQKSIREAPSCTGIVAFQAPVLGSRSISAHWSSGICTCKNGAEPAGARS